MSEKKEKSCFVFGAGDKTPLYRLPSDDDIVIAADGGLSYLKELDIAPDYVIGDFDSLGRIPDFNRERLKLLPCEKDTTDTHEAIMAGIDMGCTAFHIYGGTGGRLDHTLANIQLLCDLSEKGYRAFLYGEGYEITALTNGKIRAICIVCSSESSIILTGTSFKPAIFAARHLRSPATIW